MNGVIPLVIDWDIWLEPSVGAKSPNGFNPQRRISDLESKLFAVGAVRQCTGSRLRRSHLFRDFIGKAR